jgi:phage terminase large subunit-like protein
VNLPAADDLFRATDSAVDPRAQVETPRERRVRAVPTAEPVAARRPSGRVRHDEKMTVYVTPDELLDLEHARLSLRRDHGLAVDRGRIVREAVALVLADLDERGLDSLLVQRLLED